MNNITYLIWTNIKYRRMNLNYDNKYNNNWLINHHQFICFDHFSQQSSVCISIILDKQRSQANISSSPVNIAALASSFNPQKSLKKSYIIYRLLELNYNEIYGYMIYKYNTNIFRVVEMSLNYFNYKKPIYYVLEQLCQIKSVCNQIRHQRQPQPTRYTYKNLATL